MIEDKYLPNGWNIQTIENVGSKISSYPIGDGDHGQIKPSDYRDNGIPYIRVADMVNDRISLKKLVYIPKEIHERNLKSELHPNDVIIAKTGATIGKVAVIPRNIRVANTTASIGKITLDDEKVMPKYLLYFIKTKYFTQQMWAVSKKSAQPGFNVKDIKKFKIIVPPLPTQKKIVAILDKAEKLKVWRRDADELTDELLKSTFLEMFGDPVTNQNGFKSGTIADLVIKTQYGTSKKANEIGEGMPIVRMNNITYEGKWDFSSLKYIEFDENDKEKYLVNNGELLFNRTNSKELVGKSAVYKEKEPMAFAGYLIKIITDSPATSDFIAGHLNSEFGKLYLLKMAKSIVGMANINAQEVQNIPILIPPMELREKYAIIVEQIELLRGFQKQSNMEINDLYNSLLQKAFKGELVN